MTYYYQCLHHIKVGVGRSAFAKFLCIFMGKVVTFPCNSVKNRLLCDSIIEITIQVTITDTT